MESKGGSVPIVSSYRGTKYTLYPRICHFYALRPEASFLKTRQLQDISWDMTLAWYVFPLSIVISHVHADCDRSRP